MAQFDDIIKSGFLSEAIELLEKAETRFLELESDAQNRDVLDDLFRLNHTVKSSPTLPDLRHLVLLYI